MNHSDQPWGNLETHEWFLTCQLLSYNLKAYLPQVVNRIFRATIFTATASIESMDERELGN